MSRGAAKDLRSRQCDAVDARKRLADAEKYLEVAELVSSEDTLESHNVATGLAVLAGIAAADAACCKVLGESPGTRPSRRSELPAPDHSRRWSGCKQL